MQIQKERHTRVQIQTERRKRMMIEIHIERKVQENDVGSLLYLPGIAIVSYHIVLSDLNKFYLLLLY